MTDADPVRLYRTVRLIRRFEERAVELVHGGQIVGGIHPYLGQEGIAAGVCAALRRRRRARRHPPRARARAGQGRRPGPDARRAVRPGDRPQRAGRGGSMHAADFSIGVLGANAIVGASGAIITGAVWARRRRRPRHRRGELLRRRRGQRGDAAGGVQPGRAVAGAGARTAPWPCPSSVRRLGRSDWPTILLRVTMSGRRTVRRPQARTMRTRPSITPPGDTGE